MIRRVSFHEMAEAELIEAEAYYESEVNGLGRAFLDEVTNAVRQIQEHPDAAPLLLCPCRRESEAASFFIGGAANERLPRVWQAIQPDVRNGPSLDADNCLENIQLLEEVFAKASEPLWLV